MKNVNTFIEVELAKLGRGIVATPDEDYLNQFTDANHGMQRFLTSTNVKAVWLQASVTCYTRTTKNQITWEI